MTRAPHKSIAPPPEGAPRLFGIGLLVACVVLSGAWLVMRFAADDYARDLQTWREKLNLIAESRAADVNHWVESHFQDMRTLADNPTLQLYLTELQDAPAEATGDKSYLRNLLVFTAQRSGLSGNAAPAIPANVEQSDGGGLAVLNAKNAIVVSTAIPDSLRNTVLQRAARTPKGQEALIDIYKDASGKLYAGFITPVYAIQGEHSPAAEIGKVVALTRVDDRLFGLLKHPGVTEKTLEALLVRHTDAHIEYLSPLQDDTGALVKKTPFEPSSSAEAALMRDTGGFIAAQKDYRGLPVLATSRAIGRTPWALIVKIDQKEAMAQSSARRSGMIAVFVLLIAVIVLTIVAVWWQAYSRRSLLRSLHFKKMAREAQAQERLLRLVTDNQPEPLYIVDDKMVVRFANRPAAAKVGMEQGNMAGKSFADVRGAARAEAINEACSAAMAANITLYEVQRVSDGRQEKIARFGFIPVPHIPLVTLPEPTPGVLIVEQDITAVVRERERRTATLRQLVRALIKMVDQRDPFAANHSLMVSELAYRVAVSMDIEPVLAETTSIAAKIMNIGKMAVPVELLTKAHALSEQEKEKVRAAMNSAASLIAHIDFEGPVAKTLKQWQERWDGKGPLGIAGDDILISARIIAPTNALIGMVSPRSWRDAMSVDAATQLLLSHAGTQFDRNVVIAMLHYIENHQGKGWIGKMLEAHKAGDAVPETEGAMHPGTLLWGRFP